MTNFLHWRKSTWAFVLWSAYIATWTLITGPGPAMVALWWLGGMIVLGSLLFATQPVFQQGPGLSGLFVWPPVTNHVTSTLVSSAYMPHGLDRQAFSTLYFPGRQRHDLEAVTAYGAYRHSHAGDARSSEKPAEPGRAGPTALQGWEDEGGAALGVGTPESALMARRAVSSRLR
jgi:hypothetical protein